VYVADLERSIEFYSALGLSVTTADDEVVRMQDSAGTTLVLHVIENDWESVTRGLRLYFATHDAPAALERAKRCPGVTVLQPVELMSWGRRHGYVLDPDGWEVSIYEPEGVAA
jgi:predicted enzyme related to lactoylglutathione lyase